jgi:hypothetical protein
MGGIGSIGQSGTVATAASASDDRSVRDLKDSDRKVRAHEQAHLAAAGNLATGGPTFDYRTGPDGRRYAVGGEVNISLSEGKTPEETLRKARQVESAALAPDDPSPQDLRVAQEARALEAKAQTEMSRSSTDGTRPGKSGGNTPVTALGSRVDLLG